MFNNKTSFFKQTAKNEDGMALMLVMGVIAILTFLLAEFTIDTKINKLKIYNQQDKIQAKLNAESGLSFAMGKLRLYQEGRNKIEKDEGLKSSFPSSDLEAIIIEPFMYPPPESKKMNVIQKSAYDEFMKKTNMRGEMSVTIQKISGFLNPNTLRIIPKSKSNNGLGAIDDDQAAPKSDAANPDKKPSEPAHLIIEKKLTETLARLIKDKSDNDEEFHTKYGNLDAAQLIKELKYFVNDRGLFQDQDAENKFSQKNITPKFAPLTSIDELYLLPSWDDSIVNLIKDRLSAHEVSVIAVNQITIEDLKILFPAINNIQIEEFFKLRDGDPDKKIRPRKFKNADDFKKVITGELNIVTDAEYNERMESLKSAGLVVDTAGKLYKVSSRGSYNNAVVNIIAFVDLPIKPTPKKPKVPPPGGGVVTPPASQEVDADGDGIQDPGPNPDDQSNKDKPEPIELLNPRVIEIRLE